MGPEAQFKEFDQNNQWAYVYHRIREKTRINNYTLNAAKQPEFRARNRYRDVNPYDHSRIKLNRDEIDFINASLVKAPEANRSYILTQGPLEDTAGHFWLMVWENNCKAVLMLNNIIEKRVVKCYTYFPAIDCVKSFDDVDLQVECVAEEILSFYTIRTLLLKDLRTGASKEVLQFHYTTWPDFGVPDSPATFLDFLMAVRRSGALEPDVGPPAIHCSAGIGRSGTFCLVDTCLVLIEQAQSMAEVDVLEVLLSLRQYRMGLIQTYEQLRFSYLAIIEGSHNLLGITPEPSVELLEPEMDEVLSNGPQMLQEKEDDYPTEPPPPPPRAYPGYRPSTSEDDNANSMEEKTTGVEEISNCSDISELRRRKRQERLKSTAAQIELMKSKQKSSEKWKGRKTAFRPYVIGLSLAALIGSYLLYKYYSS